MPRPSFLLPTCPCNWLCKLAASRPLFPQRSLHTLACFDRVHSRPEVPNLRKGYFQQRSRSLAGPQSNSWSSNGFRDLSTVSGHSAVITTGSKKGTDTILDNIDPIYLESLPEKSPLILILVTPSLSKCLLSEFQGKVVEQLFNLAPAGYLLRNDVKILGAIVDRLPAPKNAIGRLPADSISGFAQALAYTVLSDGDLERGFATKDRGRMSEQAVQPSGSLNFRIPFPSASQGQEQHTPSFNTDCHVQIPLANTVFETGHHTTMSISTWKYLGNQGSHSHPPQLLDRSFIDHAFLNWPSRGNPGETPKYMNLSAPLTPLTEPRRIQAAMGNIVRKLEGPDKGTLLASQELEVSVANYFKRTNIPPQQVGIWALLIPSHSIEMVSKDTPGSSETSIIQKLISNGARLHRVQSGGGGWGKKAGLLSLDPKTTFGPEDDFFSEDTELDLSDDKVHHFSRLVDEIALSGDYIQFFVADNQSSRMHGVKARSSSQIEGNQTTIVFETTQNFTDSPTDDSVLPTSDDLNPNIQVYRGYFGACAEAGLAIRLNMIGKGATNDTQIRTKIDVPSSSLEIVYPA